MVNFFSKYLDFEILLLITGIIIFIYAFYIIKKHISFFLQSRPSRFIYYTVIFSSGFFLGIEKFKLLSGVSLFINLLSGIILINILFLSSIILNNIFDIEIDKLNKKPNPLIKIINKPNYIKIFWICFFSSLLIAFSLNFTTFLIVLTIHLTAFIYSCPPLRIKNFFPLNIIIIAFSSVLALLLGFAASNELKIFFSFPLKLAITMLIVLSLAFNVKDINDYKGDKKYNVKTIMTIFGFEKGKKITAFFAFLGYMLLPVLLNSGILFIYNFIFGALTFLVIIKSKNKINEAVIFGILFIYLVIFIIHKPSLF